MSRRCGIEFLATVMPWLIFVIGSTTVVLAANDQPRKPQINTLLPKITLSGDDGGRVNGSDWSSQELQGKVHILFYVDPDEKETNEHTSQALKNAAFDLAKFGSCAIINMAATWVPNVLINKNLAEKQKEFPNTIYVKDLKKTLVKTWGVADHASVVMLFDKTGKLLFHHDGKLSDEQIQQLLALIRGAL